MVHYANTPAYDTILREHPGEAMFGIANGDMIYDVVYEERRDGLGTLRWRTKTQILTVFIFYTCRPACRQA